jgi:hypothetical protein
MIRLKLAGKRYRPGCKERNTAIKLSQIEIQPEIDQTPVRWSAALYS